MDPYTKIYLDVLVELSASRLVNRRYYELRHEIPFGDRRFESAWAKAHEDAPAYKAACNQMITLAQNRIFDLSPRAIAYMHRLDCDEVFEAWHANIWKQILDEFGLNPISA